MNTLTDLILEHDRHFWEAYNSCDIDLLQTFFADHLEFYHDKSGLTTTLIAFMENIEKGICSNENWRLRREVLEGSVKVYPIDGYGAVISGEHMFFVKENDTNERLESRAKFFHLWQLVDNQWKMARVFSYDHAHYYFPQSKEEYFLSPEVLMQYTGNYHSVQSGLAIVFLENNSLMLKSGGFQSQIFPESADHFFIKDGNIQFRFIRNNNDDVVKMIISENGTEIDEAEKTK